MDPTVRPLLRHPLPPGVDTLRHTARRGLDAIPDPRHRAMIASVLSSGPVEQMIARTDSFTAPPADLAQAAADAGPLTAELAAFGVDLPAATVRNITQMRALMVPIADDALALAVDRIWVFSTNADDVCCHDPDEAAAMLRAGLLPEALPASPNTRYVRHMFHEIAPFCEPTFLAVFKSFFHNALTGVLMEAEFDPEASDGVDSDYVRVFNGFSQFCFVTLQFADPCLAAHRNRAFWAAAMSSCAAATAGRTSTPTSSRSTERDHPALVACRTGMSAGCSECVGVEARGAFGCSRSARCPAESPPGTAPPECRPPECRSLSAGGTGRRPGAVRER
ncbi:hypothetical protein OG401_03045 [Kitasatospora purpeofusca]|uniref:hypothetical protein n=1 Tax=Kitasatospora purpeofusca TaxID=67352 RepID=UPI00225545AE|nr:hypothetical protein [Kitasatospora purpeofusca]MCX4683296.1 hypothetical protein [Kitasatospora purpeofusca]